MQKWHKKYVKENTILIPSSVYIKNGKIIQHKKINPCHLLH